MVLPLVSVVQGQGLWTCMWDHQAETSSWWKGTRQAFPPASGLLTRTLPGSFHLTQRFLSHLLPAPLMALTLPGAL